MSLSVSVSSQKNNSSDVLSASEKSITIPIEVIFTRYLYIKKEVEISFLDCILNKKDDAALFWAFELYYSGFAEDLLYLIWRIYFEFFATLNPNLESYLLKKLKEFNDCIVFSTTNYPHPFSSKGYKLTPILNENDVDDEFNYYESKETILANIVHNLLNRKFNADVFMLREVCYNIEMEKPYPPLEECFEKKNYELISYYIVETGDTDANAHEDIMNKALNYFTSISASNPILKMKHFKSWKKTDEILKKYSFNTKLIMLSRIMYYYSLLDKNYKSSKNVYVTVDSSGLSRYETVYADTVKASYKVLPVVTAFAHDIDFLKLFKAEKERPEKLMDYYYYNWLYYASFSPVWEERIKMFEGQIDHKKKKVIFEDDEENEVFYDNYGYYPDEQTKEVKERNIPVIPKDASFTWTQFYKKYKNNGLYQPGDDELEAL